MSLDVWLSVKEPVERKGSGIFVRREGRTVEITREEWDEMNPGHEPCVVGQSEQTNCVFDSNITHNLTKMADEAGIYKACWRPEEIGATTAGDILPLLEEGLAKLEANPAYFKQFDAKNGWGTYPHLVEFVREYVEACREYPDAIIGVSR